MSRMFEEVGEQPEALERMLRWELPRAAKFRNLLGADRPRLIVLVARGTSDNAALFGRYLVEITTGIPVSLAAPSVTTLYGAKLDLRNALVVAVSQSGESTDTNAVLEQARASGVLTVGITNEPRSTLASLAAHTILVRAGRERSVAATKTYTGQMLAFYLLAYALGAKIRTGDLTRIPAAAASALSLQDEVAALAQRYRFMERTVVVGRGLNLANAFEFALKLMETSYVLADRFSSADFLHGPIALVGRGFPLFLFAPGGVTAPGTLEMLQKLHELHAETLVITDRANPESHGRATRQLVIPAKLPELLTPIPYIVPAQLFAAALAREKGLDPDSPRTLQKVTKTM